jgi:phospholipase C
MNRQIARSTLLTTALGAMSALGIVSNAHGQQACSVANLDGGYGVTPIKHLIVIVGENRTFDHLFATYQPKAGESVNNLLSEGIVRADGTPGPNYSQAHQYSAIDTSTYDISPSPKTLFSNLPAPLNGGPSNVCTNNGMCNYDDARSSEDGLSSFPVDYYQFQKFPQNPDV